MGNLLDFSLFKLIEVAPDTRTGYAFSLMPDGAMRLNGKLTDKLRSSGTTLTLHLYPKGEHILLQVANPAEKHARKINKNGTVKALELCETLSADACKIAPPARYTVTWQEEQEAWLAEWDRSYQFAPSNPKSACAKRPRRRGLEGMLPEGHGK